MKMKMPIWIVYFISRMFCIKLKQTGNENNIRLKLYKWKQQVNVGPNANSNKESTEIHLNEYWIFRFFLLRQRKQEKDEIFVYITRARKEEVHFSLLLRQLEYDLTRKHDDPNNADMEFRSSIFSMISWVIMKLFNCSKRLHLIKGNLMTSCDLKRRWK